MIDCILSSNGKVAILKEQRITWETFGNLMNVSLERRERLSVEKKILLYRKVYRRNVPEEYEIEMYVNLRDLQVML